MMNTCCKGDDKSFQLIIDDQNNNRHYVDATSQTIISDVKKKIEIDPMKSQLYLGRMKLDNLKSLQFYGITKSIKLYLIFGRNINA